MRPAGRGEYDSLYFDYPYYAFERPPELDGTHRRHTVAIVGAGPVGVTAALELARHGVASVVLDDKDTVNDGSRAICISRHSLEILQQLGVAGRFTDKALGWRYGRTYFGEREVFRLEMAHSEQERFMPMYNIQQQYIERFLIERAQETGLVALRWRSRVRDVDAGDDGVSLSVDTPEGWYRLDADYVLAADGARSGVRRALGLGLQGEAYEGRYVIADIRMRSDFPTERRAFFNPPALPDSTLLVHRQPDDIWRIDYQLGPDDDPDEALKEASIRRNVGAVVEMLGEADDWELEWWSLYKAYTLALDDYRHGRVMFIGDAAHLVPIFGVRGLNNGFADAMDAGWKLAWRIRGWGGDSLLASYTPERRGATLDVFANAGRSTRFMTPPTRGYRLMRDAALSLSLSCDYAAGFANPRQVTPYTYADSPLTTPDTVPGFAAGPAPGAPLVNRRLGEDDYLLDHLDPGFNLLYFSDAGDVEPAHRESLEALAGGAMPLHCLVVGARVDEHAPWTPVPDPDRGIAAAYGARAGSCYLVRPDRHVAARWRDLDTAALYRALATATGGMS
ncbi:FAD-dependent monooxygenase [Arhodomonas aquaeolei]|uniref:FAD-dependent monooxygenase n=1 Tax=Arhodomonas aquaeolei TaxID=2369 RepID=UPI002168323D|nr:FAD-dependent monooxygenase [Arhodomonas aquaeolei]MCS4504472.1 FAD-dependent monooxygenase [Arhodomonas aquaeolei]